MVWVAIDGPSGAGKSSISRAVAKEMGFVYVDTGALYRTVGLYLLENGIDFSDEAAVKPELSNIKIGIKYGDFAQRMLLNDVDVTDKIRTQEVANAASVSSSLPCVREFLLGMQRHMAENYNVIMDGRDIATVVLPNADVKIFLTASPEERARRRFEELKAKGEDVDYATILAEVKERDERDSTRDVAPLKPSEESVIVDSTGNEIEETIEIILDIIRRKLGYKNGVQ